MSPWNANLEPKPFVLVSIPDKGPVCHKPPTHERFLGLTGKLELVFTVYSDYLFVGSGAYEFNPNHGGKSPDVWYTFYRRNGQICIPGTSIKGAIRAIVEAISNSCVSQYRRNREDLHGGNHRPCQDWQELCPACRLFGTTRFGGRVSFSDALPVNEAKLRVVKIGELWEPEKSKEKKFYQVRRFYQTKKVPSIADLVPRPNFRFVEAVEKGTSFSTTLHFQNLSEAELGLMGCALGTISSEEKGGLAHTFTPKLGGAKPRCFGAVTFKPIRLTIWENQPLLFPPRIISKDEAETYLISCMEKAREELLDKNSWQELVKGLRPKQDEFCPRGGY